MLQTDTTSTTPAPTRHNINVLLPADMYADLRSLPGGLSISDHVRLALVDYLEDKVRPPTAFVNPSKKRNGLQK